MKGRQRLWWVLGGVFLLFCVGFMLAAYRFGWSATGFLNKSLWDWLQLLFVPILLTIGGFWLNQIQKSREEKTTQERGQIERQIANDNQREAALQVYIDKMSELLLEKDLRGSAQDDEVRKIARVRTLTILLHLDVDGVRKRRVLHFLYESDLIEKEKPIISLDGADLRWADLHRANLNKINFLGTHLSEAVPDDEHRGKFLEKTLIQFEEALSELFEVKKEQFLDEVARSRDDLGGVALSGVNLKKADLFRANLGGADLSRANLVEADLSLAYLSKANLRGAKLDFADLRWADLNGANLDGAYISRVDLSRANLKDAKNITTEELEKQAKSLKGAIMPDGSKHP
jgi:uncharacterized protein YjbI with pentapeptide repeats